MKDSVPVPTNLGSNSLEFEDVTFRYRRGAAPVLSGFSWQVSSGRTVLLGPNGAGKTTILALGANALRPNQGAVRLGALDPSIRGDRPPFRRAVGWMPQQARAVPGLSAREQVAYAAWLKGLSGDAAWNAALAALAVVGLEDRANEPDCPSCQVGNCAALGWLRRSSTSRESCCWTSPRLDLIRHSVLDSVSFSWRCRRISHLLSQPTRSMNCRSSSTGWSCSSPVRSVSMVRSRPSWKWRRLGPHTRPRQRTRTWRQRRSSAPVLRPPALELRPLGRPIGDSANRLVRK